MITQWILFIVFVSIFIATAIITLLGVTEKLHVKPEYLKPLFATLIIELIGVVISQYDSKIFAAENNSISITALPTFHQSATVEQSIKSIENVLSEKETAVEKVKILSSQVENCSVDLETKSKKLKLCTIPNSGILSNLLRLQEDIKLHGPTINFLWQSNEKKKAALHVMNILGELGFVNAQPSNDPIKASEALKLYQISKSIEPASGKLGRKTFIQLLNDYIIIETNGG